MSLLQRHLELMQKTKGNSKNTANLYIGGLIIVNLQETGPSKIITHMVDPKDLFPDVDIENL